MSHINQHHPFPVDPALANLVPPPPPPPHHMLPPQPGAPFENHPHMPMGPPAAVLVNNVAEALQPVQEELKRMATAMSAITDIPETTHEATKAIHELSERVKSLELVVKKLDSGAGSEGDDEGTDGAGGEAQKRSRKRARVSKGTEKGGPTKGERSLMFSIVRKTLYSGCEVKDMNGLKEGLTGDALAKRIAEDPPKPWQPNFRKSVKDEDNRFWVDEKIIPNALNDPDAKEALSKGDIPKEFWTKDFLRDHILKGVWESARKALRINEDPEKKEDARNKQGKANMKSRKERLFQARYSLAVGDEEHAPFKVIVKEESRTIPAKLLVPEVMSDVVEEEFGLGRMPIGVTLSEYQKARREFTYEGVTPFYRHAMIAYQKWNDVFKDMDKELRVRKAYIQPRYYGKGEARGKRDEVPEKATEIPVRVLYRCHLDEAWYKNLPDAMKKLVRPSPSGWEVDEELEHMEVETTGN